MAILCHIDCCACDAEVSTSNGEVGGKSEITELLSTTDVGLLMDGGVHSNATVAVGVALCVIVVVIATAFIWHSSRHADCVSAFKMAAVTVAPSAVVISQTGNNNSSSKLNALTPSSGAAILVPSACGRGRQHHRAAPPISERRVVIGRSTASRDGPRDDVISGSTALHVVSLNRLPLSPSNYIPYRLKQSYC